MTQEPTDRELFDDRTDPEARAELVARYDFLAQQLARKFRGRGSSLDDLIQVARFGLLNAIDRFDPNYGVKFTTFAGRTIVGEIKHYFRGHAWSVRVPRSLQELWLRSTDAAQLLSQRLGRSPTVIELSDYVDEDVDDVLEALDAGTGMTAASLDRPLSVGSGATVIDVIGEDHAALERAAAWAEIEPLISALDERERSILYMRFFEGRSQQDIAERVGLSQVHVSRLIRQSIASIRSEVM